MAIARSLLPLCAAALFATGCDFSGAPETPPQATSPVVSPIERGDGRRILLISPHADDLTLFIGGTVAAWADAGWQLIAVRVTDDRWDSVNLSEAETIERSYAEFERAMAALGVAETVHLNFPTDVLGDTSRVALRAHFIRLVRQYRPYALVSVDPHSGTGEDNLDHLVVGQAVAEAVWTAQFDKHHPEHLADGLAPHGVVEQWYYGRPPGEITDVVDVSATLDRKTAAALAHETPLRNIVHQLRLQARTAGYRVPALDEAADGDLAPLVESLVAERSRELGRRFGVGAAEVFRVVRFGGSLEWLEANGVPLEP
ncbi:MAG: PIG-L deacetylase family protein [Pseudomonadales bacterium]